MLLIENKKPRLLLSAGSDSRRWKERLTHQLLLFLRYNSMSEGRGPGSCVHTFTGAFISAVPHTPVLESGPVMEPLAPLADILSQPWHIFTSSRAVLHVWCKLKMTGGKSAHSGADLHHINLCLRDRENRSGLSR